MTDPTADDWLVAPYGWRWYFRYPTAAVLIAAAGALAIYLLDRQHPVYASIVAGSGALYGLTIAKEAGWLALWGALMFGVYLLIDWLAKQAGAHSSNTVVAVVFVAWMWYSLNTAIDGVALNIARLRDEVAALRDSLNSRNLR